MEGFRNGQGARSSLPGDVHFSLHQRYRDPIDGFLEIWRRPRKGEWRF
jgi:hypothetical protein